MKSESNKVVLVPVEPRVFDALAYLVQHSGQTVTTEELLAQLYADQFVPVARLPNAVAQARNVLGDSGQTPRYIQTVHRRGYRFIAPIEVRQGAETETRNRCGVAICPGPDGTAFRLTARTGHGARAGRCRA